MIISITKLTALLLCLSFERTKALKKCSDCTPLQKCEKASKLAKIPAGDNILRLRQSYCGFSTGISVCCSDFGISSSTPILLDLHVRRGIMGQEGATIDSDETQEPRQAINVTATQHPNIKLLPHSCGDIYEDRIIGGHKAELYEFPWMAVIAYNTDFHFACSGSLISSRYVLTAAHCVVGLHIAGVRIGEYDIDNKFDCLKGVCKEKPQDRQVEEKIVHEQYVGLQNNYEHDIALLRLKSDIDLTLKNAATICLPIPNELRHRSITGKTATVAGWGLTEHGKLSSILLKVRVPVRTNDVCTTYYSHSQINGPEATQFCAGITMRDSCQGDSGGPLMIEDVYNRSWKFVQYGIVSNGGPICGKASPGIYTDVRKYVDWILDHIKE